MGRLPLFAPTQTLSAGKLRRFAAVMILFSAASLMMLAAVETGRASDSVVKARVALFSWPGYGFWFIAKEKGFVPGLDLDIQIIEDPYESFSLMNAGQLDVVSSTSEYGPIAADTGAKIRLVAYTNPSTGTDKILLASGIENAQALVGKPVAVMEGGLPQIFMAMWLHSEGVAFDKVQYVNVLMDDAVAAMVSGKVAAGQFWEPFASKVLSSLPGTRLVASTADDRWRQTGLMADAMYMREGFLQGEPEAARLAMKAYWEAVDWWRKNPGEGNHIIARGIRFRPEEVEAVIGQGGGAGIYVFNLEEAARFMGLLPGDPPLGLANGQIRKHWELVSDWWLKFGLIRTRHPIEAGVSFEPLKTLIDQNNR